MAPKKRNNRWLVFLFFIIVICVGGGILYMRSNSETPEDRAFQEKLDEYQQELDVYQECVENAETLGLTTTACERPEYPARPTSAP